jgi:hypothetical protein
MYMNECKTGGPSWPLHCDHSDLLRLKPFRYEYVCHHIAFSHGEL